MSLGHQAQICTFRQESSCGGRQNKISMSVSMSVSVKYTKLGVVVLEVVESDHVHVNLF